MKRIASIVFILFLVFTFSACKKKKITKNIPKCLQEIIEKEQKESKSGFPYNSGPRSYKKMRIEEYNDGSSTFYLIHPDTEGYNAYKVYDYNAIEVCAYDRFGGYSGTNCGSVLYANFVRIVFQE
jgi:hypothetical protein